MSNELMVVKSRNVTPTIWNMIKEMAPVMHQARLFGVASPEAAAATMLKGYEIGIGFTASFELIQVVMGKPALSPRGALALLHNAPEISKITITRLVDGSGKFSGYECYMKRTNGFDFTARWTMEDARRAGLVKPDSGWTNYPENMCMWRAVGFCADVTAPDILAGMSGMMRMPEAYGVALSESGDVIPAGTPPVGDNVPISPQNATAAVPEPSGGIVEMHLTLEQAVDTFGADAIMAANGGAIPMDQPAVDAAVARLLEAVK